MLVGRRFGSVRAARVETLREREDIGEECSRMPLADEYLLHFVVIHFDAWLPDIIIGDKMRQWSAYYLRLAK